MASAAAILAVTEAAARALKDAPPPRGVAEIKVAAVRGQDFAAPADLSPDAPGVSLYLWRVGPNAALRNRRPPAGPDGSRKKTPVAVDLLYLLSAWGKVADQPLVLGWALRALADVGTLTRGLLNAGTMGEVFGPGEAVELSWELVPNEVAGPVSDLLRPNWPPTVVVAARGVLIESDRLDPPDGPPVQARGVAARPWSWEREGET